MKIFTPHSDLIITEVRLRRERKIRNENKGKDVGSMSFVKTLKTKYSNLTQAQKLLIPYTDRITEVRLRREGKYK